MLDSLIFKNICNKMFLENQPNKGNYIFSLLHKTSGIKYTGTHCQKNGNEKIFKLYSRKYGEICENKFGLGLGYFI